MYEIYKDIWNNLNHIINTAKPVQDISYATEGAIEIRGYHETAEKYIDKFEDVVDKLQHEQNKRKLKDLKENLDKIIAKCEEDNDFSKKTVELPNISDINELFRMHNSIGEKLVGFLSKDYESEDDVVDAYEKIDDNLETVKTNASFTFSFKLEVSLHYMIKNFYELIKKCENTFFIAKVSHAENYFHVLSETVKGIKEGEKYINEYFSKKSDNLSFDEKEEARITKRSLSCLNSLIASYYSISVLLLNKTYTMLLGYIDKFN